MRIQTTISSANKNLLIPINDLPTLQTNVRQHLGLADEHWDNHVLYVWHEGVNESTRRHCVEPFVHVLLSHEATEAIAGLWTFLPYVFCLGSTGRGMDWVIALQLNAFARPQEFAFVESRKLLRVDSATPAFQKWLEERTFIHFNDEVPVGHIHSVPADGPATPAQLGKNYLPSQVVSVVENGAMWKFEVPNALAKYHTDTAVSVDADTVARVTGDGLEIRPGGQIVRVTPVGSQLKIRAEKLRVDVKANRRLAKEGVHLCKLDGLSKFYHYPPYSRGLRAHLSEPLIKLAEGLGLVLLTDGGLQQLYALTDADGEEISFSRGVGHDMAAAFEIS